MRVTFVIRVVTGVLICGTLASACSQSPAAPSPTMAWPAATDPGAAVLPPPAAQEAGLSPEALVARGWDCRPAPANPSRLTCSPPNHPHPVLLPGPPPPDGRPATYTLLVFDSGAFAGTDLLIRSDLYNNQPCRGTGGPYRFIPRIGYFECLHPVGGN